MNDDNEHPHIDLHPSQYKVIGTKAPWYGRNWPLGVLLLILLVAIIIADTYFNEFFYKLLH